MVIEHSYWTWPFIVDWPIKNGGSFHSYVSSPEGNHYYWPLLVFVLDQYWPYIQPLLLLSTSIITSRFIHLETNQPVDFVHLETSSSGTSPIIYQRLNPHGDPHGTCSISTCTGDRPAGPMGGLATHGQISLHGAIKGHTKPRKRWAAALVFLGVARDM